jgi:hypothetical protein
MTKNFRGSLQQNLYVKSLALVSATYTITMLNLIPAITYIMAVSLRSVRLLTLYLLSDLVYKKKVRSIQIDLFDLKFGQDTSIFID